MVVGENGQYIATYDESHPYILHVLSSIKDIFESLFGACLLFAVTNLFLPSIHTLLMVVIMKPSGGGYFWFDINHSTAGVLVNRT